MRAEDDATPRARIPADVDQPDKIVYGLTARQLAILAAAAAVAYGLVKGFGQVLPQPILIAILVPVGGAAIVLALGRRDGLSLDRWLLSAIRQTRAPKHHAAAAAEAVPGWAPGPGMAVPHLRLPARAISPAGVIDTGDQAVALVAATTVNLDLRSNDEQLALIGAYGRWLNGLSGPVQLVISAQRVDLSSHAQRVADIAATIPNQALAGAAYDYAAFLDQLAEHRDPLWRTVTVAVTANTDKGRGAEVLRRADQAAAALAALGAQTAVLDGAAATAALTCATDPYAPVDVTWPRARPGAAVTGQGDLT
ncbi:PrgI family protein [Dactylosporangium salmoneum]|uniref:PrgI family protein n=1 Tax=Dactylosporangium salmoneum TaxID=53361 RepID=A0ABP5TCY2_9ACTN